MFGDTYSKRQKEAEDFVEFQEKRLEKLKTSAKPKVSQESLFIQFNFTVNYIESDYLSVKVSLLQNDEILMEKQGNPGIKEVDLEGSVDKKNI